MNLNPRGDGDMSPDALRSLDLVLGSFHSALRTTEDQTERYLAALRNPDVHILGHPRGRIYNFRIGLTADWPRVFAEAARLDKALEIDCYPDRQDLNVELLKIARDHGTRISLGTDAHHAWQLEFIELGLAAQSAQRFRPTASSISYPCLNSRIGRNAYAIALCPNDELCERRYFLSLPLCSRRGFQIISAARFTVIQLCAAIFCFSFLRPRFAIKMHRTRRRRNFELAKFARRQRTRFFRPARCASTCLMKSSAHARAQRQSPAGHRLFLLLERDAAPGRPNGYSLLPKGCSDRKYLFHRCSSSSGAPDNRATTRAEAIGALRVLPRRSILFFVRLCSGKVVSEQPAARGFEKVIDWDPFCATPMSNGWLFPQWSD
jgi:hypothetical protein